ncbi:hypothetical protein [uncultured Aquimarina sp.]|uniref:hypothetical protein n=1 Tax=uncultured Aquimarina sp. TaxID=575652 RepID=UPI0026031054|nr:hypothetical protein [uncultured Aquimarina sp.]
MKRLFNLIVGIIGLVKVIMSFTSPQKSITLFTFEVNVWVYRLIWSLVVIAIADYFYKEFKS